MLNPAKRISPAEIIEYLQQSLSKSIEKIWSNSILFYELNSI
jgi:hypothetical protein